MIAVHRETNRTTTKSIDGDTSLPGGHILLRSRFGSRQGPEPQARVDRPVALSACSEAHSASEHRNSACGEVATGQNDTERYRGRLTTMSELHRENQQADKEEQDR
jgi:hypothetical protein